jgi:hypothetical protein
VTDQKGTESAAALALRARPGQYLSVISINPMRIANFGSSTPDFEPTGWRARDSIGGAAA